MNHWKTFKTNDILQHQLEAYVTVCIHYSMCLANVMNLKVINNFWDHRKDVFETEIEDHCYCSQS